MSRAEHKWRYHTEQQRVSNLSVRAYCQQQGLCLASFYTWAKRFRGGQANTTPALPCLPAIVEVPLMRSTVKAHELTPAPISVYIGKVRIEVLPNFCERTLGRLFQVLEA